jgi:8-oxo-dGTP pyrophosphatase MutT (NUDIX family)
VTSEELEARLKAVVAAPVHDAVVYGDEVLEVLDAPAIPAAVLVPVVLGTPPGILLTKRTAHLSAHAGQVSFPGGRIELGETPEAAALREAEEEVGLAPRDVVLLGRMADYITGTGYRITPVIGLLPPGLTLRLAPYEVDAVFELPVDVLLDPQAPRRQFHETRGRLREYWVWPHPVHFIWGATAAILVHLAQKLRGDDAMESRPRL